MRTLLTTAVLAMCGIGNAWALPDPRATSPALAALTSEIKQSSVLSQMGVTLYKDQKTDMIYVTPATRKSEQGVFSPAADAGQCSGLQSLYSIAYMVPAGDPSGWKAVALEGPFSPFFDMNYGNYIRYATMRENLVQQKLNLQKYLEDHKDVYGPYITEKEIFDAKQKTVDSLKGELKALDDAIIRALNLLSIAVEPEELATCKQAVLEAKQDRLEKSPQLKSDLRDAMLALEAERPKWAAAYGAWAPYAPQLDDLDTKLTQIQDISDAVDAAALKAWSTSYKNLLAEENRLVGTAAITYSIYSNEVDLVRALPSARNVPINPMPLYDISFGGSISKNAIKSSQTNASAGYPSANLDVQQVQYGNMVGTVSSQMVPTAFLSSMGQQFLIQRALPTSIAPQTIYSPVSRGAFCMGKRGGEQVTYKLERGSYDYVMDAYKYVPRSATVFADSVGLSFKYDVAAEPTSVKCALTFNSAEEFQRPTLTAASPI
jgi:hypothetical protein